MSREEAEEASKEALQFPDAIRTSDALFGPDLLWVHVATLVVSTVRTVLCVFVCCVCACVRVARVCCACVLHVCVVRVGRVGGAASFVCLVDVPVSVLPRVFALCAFMRVSCACTCVHLYVIHGRCTTCGWLIDLGQVLCEFLFELPHFAGCNLGTWMIFALLVYLTQWQRLVMVLVRSFFTVCVHTVFVHRCVGSKRTRVFLCIGHAIHRVSWLAAVQPWTHLDRISCHFGSWHMVHT